MSEDELQELRKRLLEYEQKYAVAREIIAEQQRAADELRRQRDAARVIASRWHEAAWHGNDCYHYMTGAWNGQPESREQHVADASVIAAW